MRLADGFENVGIRGGQSHSSARLCEIDYCQSDDEGCRGYDLEIDQRLYSHPPHFPERTGASDSDDNRQEYQRRDNRFDQVDKDVTQKIDGVSPIGPQPSDQAAHDQSDHDLCR